MREVAARSRLGTSLLASRDNGAARAHFRAAVSICERALPPGHPLLHSTLSGLAVPWPGAPSVLLTPPEAGPATLNDASAPRPDRVGFISQPAKPKGKAGGH